MADVPRVLLTGVPGSGRHVVLSVLLTLGAPSRVDIGGPDSWGADDSSPSSQVDAVRGALAAARPGGICHGAIPFESTLLNVAREHDAVVVMVVRDPAEIPLALVRQIRVHGQPPELCAAFGALPDDDLEMALLDGQAPAIPLDRVYADFDGWRTAPGVLVVRFEDLIGPYGGGDDATRRQAVAALAQHVGRSVDDETLDRAAAATFNPLARTFVQGQAWTARRIAAPCYRQAFQARYADLPVRWGYLPLMLDDESATAKRQTALGAEAEHAWAALRAMTRGLRDRFGGELQQERARQHELQEVVDRLQGILADERAESAARLAALELVQRYLAEEQSESAARLSALGVVQQSLGAEHRVGLTHPARRGDDVLTLGQRLLDDALASGQIDTGENGAAVESPGTASSESEQSTTAGGVADRRLEMLRMTYAARLGALQLESDARLAASRDLAARLQSVEAESEARLSRVRLLEAQLAAAWVAADERLAVIRDLQARVQPTGASNAVADSAAAQQSEPGAGQALSEAPGAAPGVAPGQPGSQVSAQTSVRAPGQGAE